MNIQDYTYTLPLERIATHPLEQRDESKLLIYRGGGIKHAKFHALPDVLPKNAFLFFNNTRVVPARLNFQKDTGAAIEIFLLSPVSPSHLMIDAMQAKHQSVWKCTIGNLKRWSTGLVLKKAVPINVSATLVDREEGLVEFRWETDHSFAEVVSQTGETPLPPYLKRNAETSDRERYQTIYSHADGAVAAPTAGLHFTEKIFQELRGKNIHFDFVTLHVSAGTFQPVKVENAMEHPMHREQIVITRQNIENLLAADRFIIPVGTTSMRTLESVYWYGVKLIMEPTAQFSIDQTDPYKHYPSLPTKETALRAILARMDGDNTDDITGESSIYIYPGYDFKFCNGLVTNFHQPGSTLILLVAAFVGDDWKRIYREALEKDYRFLSYGDSSVLLPQVKK